jgi:hypothetical protein
LKKFNRYKLPSAALIQPWRGAPPEPFGEGTQGSFQPSLKNVESVNGRQVFGSGFQKIDWVIVSQSPNSTRLAGGATAESRQHDGSETFVGAGIATGEATTSAMSGALAGGIAAGGCECDGYCTCAQATNVRTDTASAAVN